MKIPLDSRASQIFLDLRRVLESVSPGEKLPSVRSLCQRYSASPVTVQTALARLARAGLTVAKSGDGTYKANLVEQRSFPGQTADYAWQSVALGSSPLAEESVARDHFTPRPDLISLSIGYLDESLQPLERLNRAANRALRRPQIWQRLPPEGSEELRAFFSRALGGDFHAQDTLIVSGGQAALSSTFRALVPLGGSIVLESPTYFAAISVARVAGLKTIPVPVDAEGIRPDLLEEALRISGAKVLYLQPQFQNPTGVTLTHSRRVEVLELARKYGVFIVEDDYAHDLRLEGESMPPLIISAPERTVYIRSITKITAPGLRIAAILAKGPVLGRLKAMRALDDMFVTGLTQEIALELLSSSSWKGHLKRVQSALKARRDFLILEMREQLPHLKLSSVPQGGFSLWYELPAGTDDLEYVRSAARAGVGISAGSRYFPAEPGGSFVRLTYSGLPEDLLLEGVSRLKGVSYDSRYV